VFAATKTKKPIGEAKVRGAASSAPYKYFLLRKRIGGFRG